MQVDEISTTLTPRTMFEHMLRWVCRSFQQTQQTVKSAKTSYIIWKIGTKTQGKIDILKFIKIPSPYWDILSVCYMSLLGQFKHHPQNLRMIKHLPFLISDVSVGTWTSQTLLPEGSKTSNHHETKVGKELDKLFHILHWRCFEDGAVVEVGRCFGGGSCVILCWMENGEVWRMACHQTVSGRCFCCVRLLPQRCP